MQCNVLDKIMCRHPGGQRADSIMEDTVLDSIKMDTVLDSSLEKNVLDSILEADVLDSILLQFRACMHWLQLCTQQLLLRQRDAQHA